MTRWIRNRPGRRDDALAALAAGSVGAVVGMVAFYLVRLLVAREPLEPPEEGGGADGERDGRDR